ncbi:MAG: LemA family protein [Sedimentisphaerales bacterium]|nr:LemA family protein [Sedimentisphaerales bacterium]
MYIVLGVVGFLLLAVIFVYNGLIAKKNRVKNIFSTIDVLLKKRYDLIPNIVAAVRGYAKHEKALLERITEARAKAASGRLSNDEQVMLDGPVSKMLGSIMVAVENYPDLKANENFLHLQRTLTEVEEQLSAARRAYNAAVEDYNNAVEMFPTSIVASMMNYSRRAFFEIPDEQRRNVDTKVLSND